MAAEGATAFGPVASPYGCNSWAIASSSAAVLRSSFLPSARHRGRRSVAKPSSCRSRSRGWRVTAVAGAQGLAEYLVKGAVELTAEGGPGWGSASMLLPALLWYTTAAPGSVSGLLDFLRAPVHARMQPTFSPEEVELGRQLGEGSFGVVFEGYVRKKGSKRDERLHVVLKKAKAKVEGALEVHDVEIHMNHRVKRTAPGACADFLGTLEVPASHVKGRMTEGLWLVWRFQGDKTLDQCMKHWNFPDNIAEAILGVRAVSERGFSKEETLEFETAVVKKVMCQILSNLRDLHSAGVVHRDVKPLNLVLDQRRGSFTLIDLGACVDLRSGYNYDPQESILDPTYAAPEQFVMPTCTPALPPDPLCSLISPLVWMLNSPDRFDLYSTGIILMQLCVKSLRYEPGLLAFNRYLERANYDLDLWRKRARISDTEFAILDADDGAGWELARALLQARHHKESVIWPSLGSGRPSAAGALKHRFLRESRFPFPLPRVPTDVLENLGSLLPDSREVKPDLGGAVFSAIATAAPTSEHGEKGSIHRGLENLLGDAVLAANRLSRRKAGGESKSSIPVSLKGKGDDVQQGGVGSRFPFPLPRVPTDVLGNLGSLLPDSREVKPDLGGAVFSASATAAPTTAAPTSEHGEKGSSHRGLENLLGDAVLAANRLSRRNAGGDSKSSIPVSHRDKGDDVQEGGAGSRFPFPLPKVPTDVLGNLGSLLPDSREVKPDLGGAVFSAIATAAPTTAAPTSEHGEKGSTHRGLENLLGDAVLAANRLSRGNAGGESKSSIPVSNKGKGDDVQQGGAESRFPFPLPKVPTDVLGNLGSLLPDSREVKPDLGGAVFSAIATAAPTSEHGEKGSSHRGLENLLGDAVLAANRLSRSNAGGDSISSIPVSHKGKGDDVQQDGAVFVERKSRSQPIGIPSLTQGSVSVNLAGAQAALATEGMAERAVQGAKTVSRQLAELGTRQKEVSEAVANIIGPLGPAVSASLPAAAALAAGWVAWIGLRTSSQMTYELGQRAADTVGMSGTAFLAFFFLFKPWLAEVAAAEREETSRRRKADVAMAAVGHSTTLQKILVKREEQTAAFQSLGLDEAVEAMQKQMASLEANLASGLEYSRQQSQAVSRLQSLLH